MSGQPGKPRSPAPPPRFCPSPTKEWRMLIAQSSSPLQTNENVVDVDVSVPSDESEREDSGYVPRSSVVRMPSGLSDFTDGGFAALQLYDGWMDDRPGKRPPPPLFDTFSERGDDELDLDALPTFGRVRIDDGSRSPSPAEETAKIWDRMFCTFDTSVLVCPGIGLADDDDEEGLRVPWAPS